jgi:hypothetical protein
MVSYFKKKKIEARVLTIEELDLDSKLDSSVKRTLSDFKPDVVMTISASGGTRDKFNNIINEIYDVKVITQKDSLYWRGKVVFYPGGMESDPDVLAKDIVKKLIKDSII